MGRMHGSGKGISGSTLPYVRESPEWLEEKHEEIEEKILTYARKGMKMSKIGTLLRDEYQIGSTKFFTGKKLLLILMKNNLAPLVPEDLAALETKALKIRKHMETNKQDKSSKHRLLLTESKINRLARYYKKKNIIAANWKPSYRSAVKRNHQL